MTALEYVNKITQNGTFIRLPNKETTQQKDRSGSPVDWTEVVCYRTTSIGEEKRTELLLERITLTALNSSSPYQFYKHVLNLLPKQVRIGEYDAAGWTELLSEITLELANKFSSIAINERNFKGSSTMLAILQTRMEAWQKKAIIAAEKNEAGGIQLNIQVA